MTREKKELWKEIEKRENVLSAEIDMGCGFTPSKFINEFEERYLNPLYERLAKLSHYESYNEMINDTRSMDALNRKGVIPFA